MYVSMIGMFHNDIILVPKVTIHAESCCCEIVRYQVGFVKCVPSSTI